MPPGSDPNLTTTVPPRVDKLLTPAPIGTEAPPEPPTTIDAGAPPAEPQKRPGRIVMNFEPRQPAPAAPTATATQPKGPQADTLRAEANQLRNSGKMTAAERKYGEAAARYREEAAQGGPGAATKLKAAESCERARELCTSQGN